MSNSTKSRLNTKTNKISHKIKNTGKINYVNEMDSNNYYIMNWSTKEAIYFRFTADSIDETPGTPNYTSEDIVGRTTPIRVYINNGARAINYQATFIDDYTTMSLLTVRDKLASMEYPKYTSKAITPPIVMLRLGGIIIKKGILTNLSFNWSGPIRNGVHIILKVSFTVEEVVDNKVDSDTILNRIWRM